jgi:peroxiredoxin
VAQWRAIRFNHSPQEAYVTIKAGDRMPTGTFGVMTDKGPAQLSSGELFDGKKVVVFSVPGAFTPTCSAKHLPGYIENADKLKAKGVDTVACLAVNDVFVMGAWGKHSGAEGKITMLADGNGTYTKALGLELDASGFGMGQRGQRFALVVDNGVVKHAFIEAPMEFKVSSAEHVLANL